LRPNRHHFDLQAALSRLTKLCSLQLHDTHGGDAEMEALCSLASLTYLFLCNSPLPGCLPALRQLVTL